MKIENKFRLWAVIILAAMVFIATVPVATNLATRSTMAKIRTLLTRVDRYNQLLDILRDAETGQRGFIITGQEEYLAPYYAAIGEVPALRAAMQSDPDATAEEIQTLQQITHLTDLKLKELSNTIAVRRAKGFAAVEPIIKNGVGEHYMVNLRDLIGKQIGRLEGRRDWLRARLQEKSDWALYVIIGATFINLAILTLLMVVMIKALRDRQAATARLQTTGEQLTQTVSEIEMSNRQMELGAEMLQALGAISSLPETARIVATYCAKILPALSGTLFLYRNSRDQLEKQIAWGDLPDLTDYLTPADCWALQRGSAHLTRDRNDLCCNHYSGVTDCVSHLCLPLVTQSEVIGMLYFRAPCDEGRSFAVHQLLVNRLAEQIALALSNVKLRETLRHQSIIDPLTGLYNRRYLDETLPRELGRAERNGTALAMILLDLDHFKQINDTFGHDGGDVVLKSVAQQVRQALRPSDLACRFGGEELVLVLPDCDLEAATTRAEELRTMIAALHVQHEGRVLGSVSASFGLAVFPNHGNDYPILLREADRALYQAKSSGRNRVVTAAS